MIGFAAERLMQLETRASATQPPASAAQIGAISGMATVIETGRPGRARSTNPPERLNGEIKRRGEVVGIFPNDAAVTLLIGALLLEQNDEWAVLRARYMKLVTIIPMSDDPIVGMSVLAN